MHASRDNHVHGHPVKNGATEPSSSNESWSSRTEKPHATRKAKTTETSNHDQKNGRHGTLRPEPIGHGAWSGGILRVNIGMISRTVLYELGIGVGQFMITQLAKDAPCDKVTSVVCSKTQRTNRARNLSSELSRTRVSDPFCQCTHSRLSTIFVCTSWNLAHKMSTHTPCVSQLAWALRSSAGNNVTSVLQRKTHGLTSR